MEILDVILNVFGAILALIVFIGLCLIVAGLIMGFIGVGFCDIEYDEDDDRKPPLV